MACSIAHPPSPAIYPWQTGQVTDMHRMFRGAFRMFRGAFFFDGDVSCWGDRPEVVTFLFSDSDYMSLEFLGSIKIRQKKKFYLLLSTHQLSDRPRPSRSLRTSHPLSHLMHLCCRISPIATTHTAPWSAPVSRSLASARLFPKTLEKRLLWNNCAHNDSAFRSNYRRRTFSG